MLGAKKTRFLSTALLVASGLAFGGGGAQATQYVQNGDFTNLTNGPGQFSDWYFPPGGTPVPGGLNWTPTSIAGWSYDGYGYAMNVADQAVSGFAGPATFSLWDAANGGANSWNGLAAHGGNFVGFDTALGYPTDISQTISGLTPGQQYSLGYSYAFAQQAGFTDPTYQSWTVNISDSNGNTAYNTYTGANLPAAGFSGWTDVTASFTATSSSETLSFNGGFDGAGAPPFALLSNVSLNDLAAPGPAPSNGPAALFGLAAIVAYLRRNRSLTAT